MWKIFKNFTKNFAKTLEDFTKNLYRKLVLDIY